MKNIIIALLLVLPLMAGQPNEKKPVIHSTIDPADIIYYSSPFDDMSKFEIKPMSWAKFTEKYSVGWTLTEAGWVKVGLKKPQPKPLMLEHGRWPRRDGATIIVTPRISGDLYRR